MIQKQNSKNLSKIRGDLGFNRESKAKPLAIICHIKF